MRSKNPICPEKGSVFAIILLAVTLFAALIFTVTRGLDTGTARMTTAQARTYAVDILTYAGAVSRAVDNILNNNISENDISFESDLVSGYAHTPVVTDEKKVFAPGTGGHIVAKRPLQNQAAADANRYVFTGGVIVTGQGDDTKSDLIMTLVVTYDVCAALNTRLGASIDLSAPAGTTRTIAKFTGTYADAVGVTINPGSGISQGCIRQVVTDGAQTGSYTFFKTLIVR